jgi:hypothetical protein
MVNSYGNISARGTYFMEDLVLMIDADHDTDTGFVTPPYHMFNVYEPRAGSDYLMLWDLATDAVTYREWNQVTGNWSTVTGYGFTVASDAQVGYDCYELEFPVEAIADLLNDDGLFQYA